jgi:acetyl-CoA C-acetyltransferase
MNKEIVIASACRIPIGKLCGGLRTLSAPKLGAVAIKHAVKSCGLSPVDIDEVIMGNVLSAGLGQGPGRQAAIYAGIPCECPSFSVNKVCGSGMKAIINAVQSIRLGEGKIIVAGGMESMTNAPHLLQGARMGYRLGDGKLVDSMVRDGLWDVYNDFHMGMTAELIGERYHFSREEQDEFALQSHKKALGAKWPEIVPVETKKGLVEVDEGPRPDTSLEKLANLKPAFKKGGTVTAGNASQISDGAAALVIMSSDTAEERGIKPMARIKAYASSGVKPEDVMIAPVPAVRKLGVNFDEIDVIEENEAFAVQTLAVAKELGMDLKKVNLKGGAVALGHPIGASGARIVVTLVHNLIEQKKQRGLATLCMGGGNGLAMVVER